MNDDGIIVDVLNDTGYAEWQKNPNFHGVPDLLDEIMEAIFGDFTGPTLNQVEEYLENPVAQTIAEEAASSKTCPLCLAPTEWCENRHASFDKIAFEAAIATHQAA